MSPLLRGLGCGLLVLVLVALAAVPLLWPKYRGFVVEGKQRRVLSDLIVWSRAVEAYREETGALPPESGPIDEALFPLLVPEYVPRPFRHDFWGQPVEYAISPDGEHYRIVSRGWKGEPDLPSGWSELERATTSCYEDDMVVQDGEPIRRSVGPQRGCTLGLWRGFWTIPQPPRLAQDEISARD
jgi:hypothetical protein